MACILHFPCGYYSQDKHLNTSLKADERREGDILYLCSPLLLLKWPLFKLNPSSSMFLRQDSLLSPSFLQNVRCKKWSPWRWPVQVSSFWVTPAASLIRALLPRDSQEPLIGQYRSRDMNTGLSLAEGDLTLKRKTSLWPEGRLRSVDSVTRSLGHTDTNWRILKHLNLICYKNNMKHSIILQ